MIFTKLVPNVFYVDIKDALKLFIDCLNFSIEHDELKSATPFCVIEKDGLRINLNKITLRPWGAKAQPFPRRSSERPL